jgi:integrase
MGKVGGRRNFGFGKQLAYAGKMALHQYYGEGHFSTKQTHTERWAQFASYLKQQGINDARKITKEHIHNYAIQIKQQVDNQQTSVSYGQNLLSTVNVVLQVMREDTLLNVSPVDYLGKRSHVRQQAPSSYNEQIFKTAVEKLEQQGQERVALIVNLTYAFGLRIKEACLLDTRQALKEAKTLGKIRVTQGTKGGSGKGQQRWIPISKQHIDILKRTSALQHNLKNLIPEHLTFKQWQDHCRYHWKQATTDIKGFHDMRAAYACRRYQQLTGFAAPVITENGRRTAPKDIDTQARLIISQEMGHHRIDVIASYIGSSR